MKRIVRYYTNHVCEEDCTGPTHYEETLEAKTAILNNYVPKSEIVEALEKCYNPEITDLELNEYQGKDRQTVYVDELRKKLDI